MDDKEKEFTFESEVILKKRSIRKYILIGAGVLAAAAIALVIILLAVRDRKNTHTPEEELPYTYTWKLKGETVELSIDRSASPEYDWVLISSPQFVRIEAPATQPSGSSKFILTPTEACVERIEMCLQKKDDPSDRIYEYAFDFEAYPDEDFKKLIPEISSVSMRYIQSAMTGGEGTDHPYSISDAEDGEGIEVHITDRIRLESGKMSDDWTYYDPETGEYRQDWKDYLESSAAEAGETIEIQDMGSEESLYGAHSDWMVQSSDPEVADFYGPMTDSEEQLQSDENAGISVSLVPMGKTGTAVIRIRSGEAGRELVLTVEASSDSSFRVTAHSMESFEPEETTAEEESPDLNE